MATEEGSTGQYVAPVVGGIAVAGGAALLGATFFTPLTWFAIGWMIGSWLFAPSPERVVIDPGKAEMPIINNAVRGKIVQVSIGTVKIASNIIWTNNFVTVKNKTKSGGGGKFGGSAGGKGTETVEVSYQYFWDFVYHMGMPLDPVGLLRAWLGPDELDSSFIAAVTQNSSVGPYAGVQSVLDGAQLTFEEAQFFGGDNPQTATWPHLDSVENTFIGWPKTAWLGIKQASLGEIPRVPQLTFEIGPGGATLDNNGGYLGDYDSTVTTSVRSTSATTTGYTIFTTGTSSSRPNQITKLSTGEQVDSISDADVNAVVADFFGNWSSAINTQHMVLPGTQYIITYTMSATLGGFRRRQFLILWDIIGDTKVAVGGCYLHSRWGDAFHEKIIGLDRAYPGTDVSPILIAYHGGGGTNGTRVCTWPSLTQLFAKFTDTSEFAVDNRLANFNTYLDDNLGVHASYQPSEGRFWFVGDPLTAATHMYFYITKSDMEYDADVGTGNFAISNNRATYPDGFIGYCNLGIVSLASPVTVAPINFANSKFINTKNEVVAPFDDAWKDRNGDATGGDAASDKVNDYFPQPSFMILSSGANLAIFTKGYQDVNPAFITVRAFIYNPLTYEWIQIIKGDGVTFDTVVDLGASSSDQHKWAYHENMCLYIESTNKLYQVANLFSGPSIVPQLDDEVVISEVGDFEVLGAGVDVNCAYVVRKVLTDPEAGMGINESIIDETSYQAAFDYCEDEEFKISAVWSQERSRSQILDHILSAYGGYLIYSEGVIKFGFLSANDAAVRTIDNNHLIADENDPVRIIPGARQDTYNLVKVNFRNREINYDQDMVELGDEVDQDLTGIRAMEFPPGFVMSRSMASKIAARGLWTNLYSKKLFEFKTGFKDFDLEPGDTITLVDSFFNLNEHCRIAYRNQIRHGVWENIAVQELGFALSAGSFSTGEPSPNDDNFFQKAGLPLDSIAYELPKEFHETGGTTVWFNWYSSSPGDRGAIINISPDDVTYSAVTNATPYSDTGVLLSPLPDDKTQVFAENIDILLSASNSWSVNTPIFVHSGDTLSGVTIDAMHLGAGAIWVGSEMLIYTDRTLLGLNHYRLGRVYRGWGGTHINAHNSGDYWYSQADATGMEYNENRVGETIYYKIQPYGNQGILVDISSITSKQHTFTGGFKLPSIQSTIHPWVGSIDLGTLTKRQVGSLDIQLRWEDVSLLGGFGRGGYGVGGYGRFTVDVETVSYRIEVYGSGDIIVNSLSVTTPAYDYTEAINSGDNGAWRGNVAFRITPFNRFGDAPRFDTISMDLF
jgi:hypothetical protein